MNPVLRFMGMPVVRLVRLLQEDSEEIEVVIADRDEVRRILKEERVAIMCAYMLMHFLEDEEVFGFLGEI